MMVSKGNFKGAWTLKVLLKKDISVIDKNTK
jgi:hypothetical protein